MPPKQKKKASKKKSSKKNGTPSTTGTPALDIHSAAGSAKSRGAFRFHGERPRGADFFPRSSLFEGRFGRMFRTLPPAEFDEDDLKALAKAMLAEPENPPTPETRDDDEENQGISAGYTYLGQFIDHDLTFDPSSSLEKQNDPDALEDFRTPRFDLDCLYGRGPNDQPYLYEDNGVRMLLGRRLTGNPHDRNTRDLPRNKPRRGSPARALIGDPRNDENVIVSQLQATMLRFHNRIADLMTKGSTLPDFEEVQSVVRWHYQWVVLHDFLPTIVGQDVINTLLPHLKNKSSIRVDKPNLIYYTWWNSPFMPIEFSAAAYRFGHSMIRPIYRLNTTLRHRRKIFSRDLNNSLQGFREFPENYAIDWSLFFKMGEQPPKGPERLQKSYKIDTSLVNPLGHLPKAIGAHIPSLAERNLIRGLKMDLPSGQTVARYMDVPVISDENLRVCKAIEKPDTNTPLMEVSEKFSDNAPLWYYILAEAQQAFYGHDETPIRLGKVGGGIVAEVLIGLLLGDHHTFLSQEPSWQPIKEFTNGGEFKMADLIKQAMLAR